jgi:NADH:ubiquinone oxidoreductase subunit 6 (subunit J)
MLGEVNLFLCLLLCAVGVLFHFITKLYELEQTGVIITPWAYWRRWPYASLIVVFSALLMILLQYYIRELTYSASILTGIACNSLGDKLRARGEAITQRRVNLVDTDGN